jgi:hypothetical protein
VAQLGGLGIGDDAAVEFMAAGLSVFGIVAAACSSPQTTELNAGARAATLMKWVNIGMGMAAVFVLGAAYIAQESGKGDPRPILAGGTLAAAMMYASYAHAKKAGLASGQSPTESY